VEILRKRGKQEKGRKNRKLKQRANPKRVEERSDQSRGGEKGEQGTGSSRGPLVLITIRGGELRLIPPMKKKLRESQGVRGIDKVLTGRKQKLIGSAHHPLTTEGKGVRILKDFGG